MWFFKINSCNTATAYCATANKLKKSLPALVLLIMTAPALSANGRTDYEAAKEYFEIAQAYAEVSKYDKAVIFYLKAAQDPMHKNAAEYNLARVYGLQGNWNKARALLERQYKEAPGNILICKAYAYSLTATGDAAQACKLYKKIYDNDTESPEAALNYARILMLAKRYHEAEALIEELKPRFTENAEKKVLDELEEKIKEAQKQPKKPDALKTETSKPAIKTPETDKKPEDTDTTVQEKKEK